MHCFELCFPFSESTDEITMDESTDSYDENEEYESK